MLSRKGFEVSTHCRGWDLRLFVQSQSTPLIAVARSEPSAVAPGQLQSKVVKRKIDPGLPRSVLFVQILEITSRCWTDILIAVLISEENCEENDTTIDGTLLASSASDSSVLKVGLRRNCLS